jgi:AraC family transcriptional regulator, regulatory protein of adaptative response / DNA-3-methyladenine glycosylase II
MAYSAVVTTGIYCRPDCSARPKVENVRLFEQAAAAEAAGFRPCLRCRPYRTEPPISWRDPELVCRAVHMITAGALDRGSEQDLAARLGVSARHLRRLFAAHIGVTPDGLARSSRAHFARRLLDDTDLPVTDVAFAAGFGSIRQLHRATSDRFHASPTQLRAKRRAADRLVADGGLELRLPYEGEVDWSGEARYLAARAIPGVEAVEGDTYRRTVIVDGDPGVIEIGPGGAGHLVVTTHLPHWEGLIHVASKARRIAGLDVDLAEASAHLAGDPTIGPLLAAHPGLRVTGTWDPFETGVRAIVGQQVSVGAATTVTGRIAARWGTAVPGLGAWGLSHTFPEPVDLADADLTEVGLTATRAAAIRAFAAAVAADVVRLDGSVGLDTLVASIEALPGLGPWTAHYLALRIGEPNAFPSGDLGLRRAYAGLALGSGPALPVAAESWRPWRAVAAAHLWAWGAGGG